MQEAGIIDEQPSKSEFPTQPPTSSSRLCKRCETVRADLESRVCRQVRLKDNLWSSYMQLPYVWHFSYPKALKLEKARCELCHFLRQSVLRRVELLPRSVYRYHSYGSLQLGYSVLGHNARPGGHIMLSGSLTAARTRFHREKSIDSISWDAYSSDGKHTLSEMVSGWLGVASQFSNHT